MRFLGFGWPFNKLGCLSLLSSQSYCLLQHTSGVSTLESWQVACLFEHYVNKQTTMLSQPLVKLFAPIPQKMKRGKLTLHQFSRDFPPKQLTVFSQSNLGFIVLLKDTSTCGQEELRIKLLTLQLMADLSYQLNTKNRFVQPFKAYKSPLLQHSICTSILSYHLSCWAIRHALQTAATQIKSPTHRNLQSSFPSFAVAFFCCTYCVLMLSKTNFTPQ